MILLTLIASLLLTGSAWAAQMSGWPDEPCTNGDLFIDTASKSYVVCEHHHWHLLKSACEIDMEAAMKAMDEFVPTREPSPPLTVTTMAIRPCEDDACLKKARLAEAEAELAMVKRREDAISAWKAVKQACWRATGSPGAP